MPDLLREIASDLTISPLNRELVQTAQKHLDTQTKPKGSLGCLEELACRLYAINSGKTPLCVQPAIMFTVAADHGVAQEGVAPFPQAVTRQMVQNILQQGAGISVLCHTNGLTLRVVDAGCLGGAYPPHPFLLDCRLGEGTANMTLQPAMTRTTALQGVRCGVKLACEAWVKGYKCLGVGELGIANTTSATALYCALFDLDPDLIAGPGSGASPAMVRHKAQIVKKALTVHANLLRNKDPLTLLACLGGFEIAVICGLMLGAASKSLPILVDGFICCAAYALALALSPLLADYAILSHCSAEPGFRVVLDKLQAQPLLNLNLRLGEGTGGAMAYPLLRCAAAIFNDMATFEQAGVSQALQ